MKKILALMIATMTILSACTSSPEDDKTQVPFKVATLSGPTSIGFVNMMEAENHTFEILGTPDEVVTKIVKGEVDIAAVPANLASTLYNKTEGEVSVLAINTLGVIYVVQTGDEVKSIEDLAGKTIYSTGKGATPEYALNYVLENAGILDQVTVEYKSEHSELAALMAQGKADIAVLPEPFITVAMSKNPDINVALDLTEEWDKLDTDSSMITGVLVVRNEVIEENKESLDKFLEQYEESIGLANSDVIKTAELTEKYGILPKEQAEKAIPNCNITYIDGEDMEDKVSKYLGILNEQNPKSIGGKLPSEDFYYKK